MSLIPRPCILADPLVLSVMRNIEEAMGDCADYRLKTSFSLRDEFALVHVVCTIRIPLETTRGGERSNGSEKVQEEDKEEAVQAGAKVKSS